MVTANKGPPMETTEERDDAPLGIKVNKRLFKQIQYQVHLQKHSRNHRYTQIDWIKSAIEEKLLEEGDHPQIDALQGVNLSFKLPRELLDQIDRKLELVKKSYEKQGTRGHYSRKSWIIDAIEKKLEQITQENTSSFSR